MPFHDAFFEGFELPCILSRLPALESSNDTSTQSSAERAPDNASQCKRVMLCFVLMHFTRPAVVPSQRDLHAILRHLATPATGVYSRRTGDPGAPPRQGCSPCFVIRGLVATMAGRWCWMAPWTDRTSSWCVGVLIWHPTLSVHLPGRTTRPSLHGPTAPITRRGRRTVPLDDPYLSRILRGNCPWTRI